MELLEAIDQGASHSLGRVLPGWLISILIVITHLGDTLVLLLLAGLGALWLAYRRRYRRTVVLLGTVLAGLLLTWGAKLATDRPRPNLSWAYLAIPVSPSFPSGHALNGTVVLVSLALLLTRDNTRASVRTSAVVVAGVLAFLIGFSRMFLGVNYVSDVVAGWAAGTALVFVQNWLLEKDQLPLAT